LGAGVLLLSAIILFWIEWIVEGRVLESAEEWALRLTPFARMLVFIMAPLVALPLYFWNRSLGLQDAAGIMTEEEIKTLVDAGQEEGVLQQGERKMIYSIIELGDTLAREIMVPRIDIVALEVNTPLADAVDALLKSGNSRVPVYDESVDYILGLLYAKDLLRVWRQGEQLESLRQLLRPAHYIPEAKKVIELLAEMQSQRIHMAVVVDEYGGVAGLVTLEDIVEEVLGEIQDEYDQGEESPYQELSAGEYIFQGKVDLDDFNEILSSNLPKDDADTLGGFMYSRIGRVPSTGERIHVDNLLLTVEQVTGRRIRKVRAEKLTSLPHNTEEETHVDG
jgi:CBS domain containing-hemolysin-like protein